MQAHTFSSLFNQPISQFHDRLRHAAGQPVNLCMHNGVQVFCQARLKTSHWFSSMQEAFSAQPSPQSNPNPQAETLQPPNPSPATRATTAAAAGRASLSSLHYLNTGDPQVAAVLHKLQRVQGSDIPIMILGETGTGKDILAQAIHNDSARARRPFVSINCASIPETLIESELFGYEEGAFTGAKRRGAPGKIQMAHGGTLFLDEIGDMPFDLQTRLLRVLSDGNFYRVGGHSAVKANVRVIAATHQDLEQRVKEGVFREDLYHRLNVIRLRLPALRERREDVPVLARYFLQRSAQQLGVEPKRIADAALERLSHFQFPGNVRQLENICHWLTVMAPAQVIEVKDLPPEVLESRPSLAPAAGHVPLAALSSGGGSSVAALGVQPSGSGPDGAVFAPELPSSAGAEFQALGDVLADGVFAASGVTVATWEPGLEQEALALLNAGRTDVWDVLTRRFETSLIQAALATTRGRRIEAAQKLGIGRNTITRKIQELGIDD